LAAAAVAVSAAGGSLRAAPVGVDGTIGAEWTGVSVFNVVNDPAAPINNFATPTNNTSAYADYSVQVRDDGAYYYGALQITDHANLSPGDFANLYFDTDPQNGNGSDVGFEITNNRFFIAGAPGYYDATPYLTYAVDGGTHTIEFAIDNAFFTSSPQAGAPYPLGFPTATGDVTLRLSQSFGYSVAGGTANGDAVRLGVASVASGTATPLPSAASMSLGTLAVLGVAGVLRKKAKMA
jgi:hypothetical protein